ncbi:hypothetical protein Tco_0071398 [Tanacetum coccineum]
MLSILEQVDNASVELDEPDEPERTKGGLEAKSVGPSSAESSKHNHQSNACTSKDMCKRSQTGISSFLDISFSIP